MAPSTHRSVACRCLPCQLSVKCTRVATVRASLWIRRGSEYVVACLTLALAVNVVYARQFSLMNSTEDSRFLPHSSTYTKVPNVKTAVSPKHTRLNAESFIKAADRGLGMVGYNVGMRPSIRRTLIVAHEVDATSAPTSLS